MVTTNTTMTKLATSPVVADNALATSSIMTNGFLKRAKNCSQSGVRLTLAASLGPKSANRALASAASRPERVVSSRAKRRSTGSLHTSSAQSWRFSGFMRASGGGSCTSLGYAQLSNPVPFAGCVRMDKQVRSAFSFRTVLENRIFWPAVRTAIAAERATSAAHLPLKYPS